ncbi:MAG TPA: hypothetical protein VI893_02980 [Thermoplasmata archaeon]|nr:hypothetical protein [Thermoplasmata archaeon]
MARLRRRTKRLIARVVFHVCFALPFILLVWLAPNCRWEYRYSVVVDKDRETTCNPEFGCIVSYWLEMQNGDQVKVDLYEYQRRQPGDAVGYRWNWCW